jgi:large subunit ribosomal protein L23
MHNEKLYTLIKSPIVTEKSARVGETLKQIVFKVDLNSNKREIKKAVEELFKAVQLEAKTTETGTEVATVAVKKKTKVTTSVVKVKRKRNRFGLYKRSDYKKAFVSLSKDSEIQFEGIN